LALGNVVDGGEATRGRGVDELLRHSSSKVEKETKLNVVLLSEFDVVGSSSIEANNEYEEEDKVVAGAGEDGVAVLLDKREDELAKKVMAKVAINTVASDKVSLRRRVPDTRSLLCREIAYDVDLPSASVIIVFTNEEWSPLLRTVWSVLDRTPSRYLHEILLIDDFSDKPHLLTRLSRYIARRLPAKVRLKRLRRRSGLIRARLEGARLATGQVLLFLDSHCECGTDWIQPLLHRIKQEPGAFVVPVIDVIDDKTLEYYQGNSDYVQLGGFRWDGHFNWIDIPHHELARRGSSVSPTRTPTMAGGLFAVLKDTFYRLGSYDEQMDVWGGMLLWSVATENIIDSLVL
jgi:polypeptide N-acetylgalactosaminyltransferase